MKYRHRLLSLTLAMAACAILGSAAQAGARAAFCGDEPGRELTETSNRWVVDRADNICGLDDPRMLSKPAKLDYDLLLTATPEMKKIRDDKVDPNSSEGIQLRQKAVDRVRNAADKVRVNESYCSVWKQIRHQDGRVIADVTELVRLQM